MSEWYVPLKHLHITAVVLTGISFTTRAIWMMRGSPLLEKKLVKVLPHVIDTVLFLTAIGLAVVVNQAPFKDAWLTAKVLALLAYIVFGALGLKRAKTKNLRVTFVVLAWIFYAYIIGVALTKSVTL